MDYTIAQDGNRRAAVMSGRLTFQDQRNFRALMEALFEETAHTYVFDLNRVEFIDSAGLGMLLLGKDRADAKKAKVTLRRPPSQVRRVLDIAKFDTLFDIEE